ncbi:MAG: glycosyltransferase family 2 protein [archaeon]
MIDNSHIGVIMPVKNEEDSVSDSIDTIIEQTHEPIELVIVNDGSTDATPEIIAGKANTSDNITIVELPEGEWDLGIHYAKVCISGFNKLLDHKPELDYIGLVDADILLPKNYFEKIIKEFTTNSSLGIAGGPIKMPNRKGEWVTDHTPREFVHGANRIWRRQCFDETGGYIPTYCPDSVSNAKARIRGWQLEIIPDLECVQVRETSTGNGLWNGYANIGRAKHFLNANKLYVLLKGVQYLMKAPHYPGIAYFLAYANDVIRRVDKIPDEEIRNYYRKDRPYQLIRKFVEKYDPRQRIS